MKLTPAFWRATASSQEIPVPVSFAITGTSTVSQISLIESIYPLASTSPSGWMDSWSGFKWIAKISLSNTSTASKAKSLCGAPILPNIKAFGAFSLTTSYVSLNSGWTIAALWLPKPNPIFLFSATVANSLFMSLAAGCPPVIAVMNKGESNFLPKTSVDRSISSLWTSGKALWINSISSNPVLLFL